MKWSIAHLANTEMKLTNFYKLRHMLDTHKLHRRSSKERNGKERERNVNDKAKMYVVWNDDDDYIHIQFTESLLLR